MHDHICWVKLNQYQGKYFDSKNLEFKNVKQVVVSSATHTMDGLKAAPEFEFNAWRNNLYSWNKGSERHSVWHFMLGFIISSLSKKL